MAAAYKFEKREQLRQFGKSDSVWSADASSAEAEAEGETATPAAGAGAAAAALPAAWEGGGSALERVAAYGFMVGEYGLFLFFLCGMASGLR